MTADVEGLQEDVTDNVRAREGARVVLDLVQPLGLDGVVGDAVCDLVGFVLLDGAPDVL